MIPYNLLLLPLIAGYIVLVYSVLFKYNFQRFTQNRLIFEAVFVAIVIIFFTFISRAIVEYYYPEFVPSAIKWLEIIPIRKVDYLWTGVFSFILPIILVAISNVIILWIYKPQWPIKRAVDKNGDEIEKLFKRSAIEGILLQITLKNNKVYIGFSEDIPIPQKTNFLTLTPIISGYRHPETKRLTITTDYFSVVDQYIESLSDDKETVTLNTDVIIRQDEILTAGIYEQEIYDLFNKPSNILDDQAI
jgi:hypothetical protein